MLRKAICVVATILVIHFHWVRCTITIKSSKGYKVNSIIHNNFDKLLDAEDLPELGYPMRDEFLMAPSFIQLNHGAKGGFPKSVLSSLHQFQLRSEQYGDLWWRRELQIEMTKVRQLLAKYMNVEDADDIVIIPNTTTGMNAILRSWVFRNGSKILQFNTSHFNIRSIIQYVVDTNKSNDVTRIEFTAKYPNSNEIILRNFEKFVNEHHSHENPIAIAVLDHITQEGIIQPIKEMIGICKSRGILVIVDGSHALGQITVNVKELDPDFYVANCHKWLYTARGVGVMYVNPNHQPYIHPASISSSYSVPSNFQAEFFNTGTIDFSPYLTIPEALEFRSKIGEEKIRDYTHSLAVEGGNLVAAFLNTSILQDEEQIGSMINVELPLVNINDPEIGDTNFWIDNLIIRYSMYARVFQHNGKVWARFSTQIYNDISDFQEAAGAFKIICEEVNAKNMLMYSK